MTRCVSFATALTVFLASSVAAQELLTLDAAIQAALAQNASLRATQAAAAEATAHASEARAGWYPRISVTESWQRSDQPVYVFSSLLASRQFSASNFAIEALNHPDATSFFQTSFGIQQVVFDGGRQRSAADSATLRQEIANHSVDEAAASLALAVTQAFGRVLVAESSRRAAAAALGAAQEDRRRTAQRRDAGVATDADVLALAAHVANLQQQFIQSQSDAAIARAELNRLMGVPVDREFQLSEPAAFSDAVGSNTPLEALFAEAERARPELVRAAAAERLADADRANAGASLMPQIAAQAGMDISGTQFTDRASAWAIGATFRWQPVARWCRARTGARRNRSRRASASGSRRRSRGDPCRRGDGAPQARSGAGATGGRQRCGRAGH